MGGGSLIKDLKELCSSHLLAASGCVSELFTKFSVEGSESYSRLLPTAAEMSTVTVVMLLIHFV